MSWSLGDAVALREIWRGRVWEARPAIVVRDDPELRIFYRGAGSTAQIPVDANGREIRLPSGDWRFAEWRAQRDVLSFALPDAAHAVLALNDAPSGEFLG